jgi:hypothetical protein
MQYFNFRLHFILLSVAIIVLAGLSFLPLYDDPLFACAANGILHATALVASLRASTTALRRLLFAALTAGLSIMSLYVGIIALVALSILPDSQRLPAVVVIASMCGAITYGSLVRIFWVRAIRPRVILGLAAVCSGATLSGYILKLRFDWTGTWWLAAIWWLTFSLCLKFFGNPPARKTA